MELDISPGNETMMGSPGPYGQSNSPYETPPWQLPMNTTIEV